MLYFIVIFVFLALFLRNLGNIKRIVHLYKNYKSFIDPTNQLSHFQVFKSIITLFFSVLYSTYSIYNNKYSQKTTEKFNKKYIKISYKFKNKNYHYLLKVPKGIPPLKSITDENDNDITDIIEPYLGPNLDCHGASIYPRDFGYAKIKITTVFDKLVVFDEDQKIELTD